MSNITNLNRDYLIKINVKEATIDVPKMTFWNTDKKTSNMFVQLVINMSENELIKNYATIENATDYKITLNVIKPKTNQYRTFEAKLLNEEEALFEIDLTSEFTDQVGDYSFEFEVSSKVDSNDESITTSNGIYKVNGSILTNLNEETSSSPDLPILKQLIEQVKSLQGGDLTGYQKKNDAAQKTIVEDGKLYLTKLDGTKLDDGTTLPTGSGTSIDDTNTTTDKTWSSSKIDSQFKDITKEIGNDTLKTTAQDVKGAINEVFQSASNGKQLIANAITGKGVKTSVNDSFQVMATNIGKISGGGSTTYSVTNNLSHAVNNNSNTRVEKYNSYSANITVETGYKLNSITVTMGGTDITSSCYSNGNISIEHVTGNIVITVTTSIIPPNTYSVTNTLTQCTSDNNSTTVTEGQSYTATITANIGYTVNSIVVKMGNTDISSSAVSGNIITIANITGNIVIIAIATQNALYSFGVMSDIHIPTDETSDTVYGSKYQGITKFTNAINKLKDIDIDFLCATGDLTTYGYDVQYNNLSNILKNFNKPFYSCNGNHDGENNTSWNTHFGHDLNYTFVKNDDVFIFISAINETPAIDYLKTQLNAHKNKRIFLFMHFPLFGYAGLKTNQIYGFEENSTKDDEILSLLKSHINVYCFSGHTHYIFELQNKYPNINVHTLDYYYTSLIHVPSLTQPRNDAGNMTNLSDSNQYLEMWKVNVYADKIVLNAINLVNNQTLYSYEIDTNADYNRSNGLTASTFNVALNEGSTSKAITIGLEKAPSENVTINITSNNKYVTPSKTSIAFTPTNYSDTFTVSAVDDGTTADYTCLIEITSAKITQLDINIAVTNTTVEDDRVRYDFSSLNPKWTKPFYVTKGYEQYVYVMGTTEVDISTVPFYHLTNTNRMDWRGTCERWRFTNGEWSLYKTINTSAQPAVLSYVPTHSNKDIYNATYENNVFVTSTVWLKADLTPIS